MTSQIYQLNLTEDNIVIGYSQSNVAQQNLLEVSPDVFFEAVAKLGRCKFVDGFLSDFTPPPLPISVPDNPTLSDWRVGLLLWGRRDELLGKVEAERAKGTVIGKIADERVNYANNVLRSQLVQLKGVFDFSELEIDESLWRAAQVAKGDMSGVWPLPT